jgi:hypothetical protein
LAVAAPPDDRRTARMGALDDGRIGSILDAPANAEALTSSGSRRCSDDDGRLESPHIETMATLDLSDDEWLALAAELKHTIAEDRYPLVAAHPHPAGHTQQARPAAGPRSRAPAEALRAAVEG